jgi:hypothetical protein
MTVAIGCNVLVTWCGFLSAVVRARVVAHANLVQVEVCGAQDQLERVFLQLLQHPLKLICSPVQVTLAECYVALFEWGDSRKLLDALHNVLKVISSKADVSNRVCVRFVEGLRSLKLTSCVMRGIRQCLCRCSAAVFVVGEVFANHGSQLAPEALNAVAIIAKQCKSGEVSSFVRPTSEFQVQDCGCHFRNARWFSACSVELRECWWRWFSNGVQTSVRAASAVALQRIVEGTADTDGGLKCHGVIAKVVDKCASDRASTVRSALALVVQALATASLGFVTVKLPVLLAMCAKVRPWAVRWALRDGNVCCRA